MGRKPLIGPRQQGSGMPENLSAIDRSVRRLFYGVCGLGSALALLWMLAIPGWRHIPRPLVVALPALLLWSFVAAAYSFHTLYGFARKIRDELVLRQPSFGRCNCHTPVGVAYNFANRLLWVPRAKA